MGKWRGHILFWATLTVCVVGISTSIIAWAVMIGQSKGWI